MDESLRTIGPYRTLRTLGHGGMGVVYQAVEVETGRMVALKTVHVSHPAMFSNIRREIRVLARVRHPGVVRILAEGVDQGYPWYAMELLAGATLRHYTHGMWHSLDGTEPPEERSTWWTTALGPTRPLDVVDPDAAAISTPAPIPPSARKSAGAGALLPMLTLVRRLCAPLAHIHGLGIVHRDLKPENVLIRPNGMPVLVDFGLMSKFGSDVSREDLQAMAERGGTFAYMAPEQAQGELVDARADLYALGCVLYEMVTGVPPFRTDDPAQLLNLHRTAEPTPPSQVVEGIPGELDQLILSLLAKDPRERLGYADVASQNLEQLGAKNGLESGPPPRPYLYRPRLTGRTAAMESLEHQLVQAAEGQGRLLYLGGESGVGKTRLAMEVAARASRLGLPVYAGECLPSFPEETDGGGGAPLQALRGLLRAIADHCMETGQAEADRILGRRGRVLAQYEPELARLPGQADFPAPAELSPDAARLRLHTYLLETIESFCETSARLLILDDLQWADDLTLDFLEFLARSEVLGRIPFMLLGLFRTEEVGSVLKRQIDTQGIRQVKLDRLDELAVMEIVRDMLGLQEAPESLCQFLARRSEGNPFFVAEYLRTAVTAGALVRDSAGQWRAAIEGDASSDDYEHLPLPSSLRDLLARRLTGLSPQTRGVVESASVWGRNVNATLLVRSAGLREAQVSDALEELVLRQVMEPDDAGNYRFVHEKTREAAYQGVADADRRRLHRRAAETIESLPTLEREQWLGELALHWKRAGDTDRARDSYLAAAQLAVSRYAHQEAERLYRAYLDLVDGPSLTVVRARYSLAEMVLRPRGRSQEALAELEQAREQAEALGDEDEQLRCLRSLAMLQCHLGHIEESKGLYQSALELAQASSDPSAEDIVRMGMVTVSLDQGRIEEARALLKEILQRARANDDATLELRGTGNMAIIHMYQGEMDEARRLYAAALAIARELGDRKSEARSLESLAMVDQSTGNDEEARARYQEALSIYREMGDLNNEAVALLNLSSLQKGDGSEASVAPIRKALEILRSAGDRRAVGTALGLLAEGQILQGRLSEARRSFQEAADIGWEVGDRRLQGLALSGLATTELFAARGRGPSESLAAMAEAMLAEVGESTELAACLCDRGHIALARGQSARPQLARARAIATRLGVADESSLGRALARLKRAIEAFEAGTPLMCGRLAEDVPEKVRAWRDTSASS